MAKFPMSSDCPLLMVLNHASKYVRNMNSANLRKGKHMLPTGRAEIAARLSLQTDRSSNLMAKKIRYLLGGLYSHEILTS